MFPEGYHQYHMRFHTDIRDASHMNNDSIRAYIEACSDLESLIMQARNAESTAEKLRIFRELQAFETHALMEPSHHMLEALSAVDPQTYVDLNSSVKSMSIQQSDGSRKTDEKRGND